MSAVRDFSKIVEDLKKTIKLSSNKNVMQELGGEIIRIITRRTRLGYGVKEMGRSRQSLKSMRQWSEKYRNWRLKNRDKLSPLTSPNKQNLTLTGHMIHSMNLVKASAGKLIVGFGDNFAQLKAQVNADRGWQFMNLSKPEISQLTRFYRNNLENKLNKIRRKTNKLY